MQPIISNVSYHLPRFRTLFDVHYELLLLLLEFASFTVELALRLGEGTLMLA
jgi:hypothetical protein